MRLDTQQAKQLLELYKGINATLYDDLNDESKQKLVTKTIKELSLLAESAASSGGEKLHGVFEHSNTGAMPLRDIESLIEYGRGLKELPKKEQRAVGNMEIQQELSHFSRIMNLDNIITGFNKKVVDVAIDFARFMELLAERRHDRGETSLSSWGRPSKALSCSVVNSPVCGLLQENTERNRVALLAVRDQSEQFSPREHLYDYATLVNRFNTKTATFLYDYLLYLSDIPVDTAFVSVYSYSVEDGMKVEIAGGGGCGVLITQVDAGNKFARLVSERMTVGRKRSYGFGSEKQTPLDYKILHAQTKSLKVFCFHPQSWEVIETLSDTELNTIMNTPFKNGWLNQNNALSDYLQSQGVNAQIASLNANWSAERIVLSGSDHKHGDFDEAMKAVQATQLFKRLAKKPVIVTEAAHLHADRLPGEEQWDSITLTDTTEKMLRNEGFVGPLKRIVMVDDYHVVNRLDYASFEQGLRKRGLKIDEMILESSPITRLIAVDILCYLAFHHKKAKNWQIRLHGDNLYLEVPSEGLSIELVADIATNPVIGCVLFDVAFTLYKSDTTYYNRKYAPSLKGKKMTNIHEALIAFYNKTPSPVKRRAFVERFYEPIPDWNTIVVSTKQPPTFPSSAAILNILEDFYRPQQKKVNKLLRILGQGPIYSLFYNMEASEATIETAGIE